MAETWYLKLQSTELGPLTSKEIKKLADDGRLKPDDLVRRADSRNWLRASGIRGLTDCSISNASAYAAPVIENKAGPTHKPPDLPSPRPWWVFDGNKPSGPYEQPQLLTWLSTGQLTGASFVCPVGDRTWRPISQCREFVAPTAGEQIHGTGGEADSAPGSPAIPDVRMLANQHADFTMGMVCLIVTTSFGFVRPLLFIPVSIVQYWLAYKLSKALGYRHPVRWGVATVIPVLGLLFLFVLSRRATHALQQAGIKVGLGGPEYQD